MRIWQIAPINTAVPAPTPTPQPTPTPSSGTDSGGSGSGGGASSDYDTHAIAYEGTTVSHSLITCTQANKEYLITVENAILIEIESKQRYSWRYSFVPGVVKDNLPNSPVVEIPDGRGVFYMNLPAFNMWDGTVYVASSKDLTYLNVQIWSPII